MAQNCLTKGTTILLNDKIRKILKGYQIDYLGFADLSKYQNEIYESGGNIVKGYPCGISIGIVLPDSIVDFLPQRRDMDIAGEYRIHAYETINNRLNIIASVVSSFLEKKGYKALPLTAADRSDEKTNAIISHKMVAHIAGLGWIGKNCLLITPRNGPRVRFISVLTNAPLRKINHPIEQKCGECSKCVKICPTKAIIGKNYVDGESREERFYYEKCSSYFEKMKLSQQYSVCGMCLYICPYGKNEKKSHSSSLTRAIFNKSEKTSS